MTCPGQVVARAMPLVHIPHYFRGTSLTKKRTPLRPYRRPVPRVLGESQGGGRFLMSEVPLYSIQGFAVVRTRHKFLRKGHCCVDAIAAAMRAMRPSEAVFV